MFPIQGTSSWKETAGNRLRPPGMVPLERYTTKSVTKAPSGGMAQDKVPPSCAASRSKSGKDTWEPMGQKPHQKFKKRFKVLVAVVVSAFGSVISFRRTKQGHDRNSGRLRHRGTKLRRCYNRRFLGVPHILHQCIRVVNLQCRGPEWWPWRGNDLSFNDRHPSYVVCSAKMDSLKIWSGKWRCFKPQGSTCASWVW